MPCAALVAVVALATVPALAGDSVCGSWPRAEVRSAASDALAIDLPRRHATLLIVFIRSDGRRRVHRIPNMLAAACEELAGHIRKTPNGRGSRASSDRKGFRVFCVPAYVPGPFASTAKALRAG